MQQRRPPSPPLHFSARCDIPDVLSVLIVELLPGIRQLHCGRFDRLRCRLDRLRLRSVQRVSHRGLCLADLLGVLDREHCLQAATAFHFHKNFLVAAQRIPKLQLSSAAAAAGA